MAVSTKFAAAVALTLAVPAIAGSLPDQSRNEVRVSRAWLAADTPAATQHSLSVLGRAAMEACGASTFSLPDYQTAVRNSSCWQASMTGAIAQVGSPALTDAFNRRASVELVQAEGGSGTRLR